MLTEAELLQYIYQTTEMGRDGIQSVLPHAEDETFHQAQSHGQGILRDDERDENHG